MRIGIDARLIEETGVGRYIRNLIAELGKLDSTNEYVVFLRKKSFDTKFPHRWEKRLADVHWHTVREQFVMPRLFVKAKLDLVHIPYHNPPMFYPGRMVVTIHDLTTLHFNTGRATTLPPHLYQLKRLGYLTELAIGLRKATRIIAVSETTKKEIVNHFRVSPEKISVTREGVSHTKTIPKRFIAEPYVLYVGNAYPHKNVETLIRAMHLVPKQLVLVGNDDIFYRRLKAQYNSAAIRFFGPANDMQLASLYANADAFVFPSLMEGFGLPALEALSYGTPVAISDIPVFHEIVGEYATYFDPSSPESIANALLSVQKKTIPEAFFDKYSWKRMAEQTLHIYESCICI